MEKYIFWTAKIKQTLKFVACTLVAGLIFFIFFEGLCSIFFVLKSTHRPIAEKVYTKYDHELGWVSIPNVYIKNMYGDGIYIRTNSQGFRADKDFSTPVPADKTRVVCSGDSFTFGYGVDNDHTWCQLLSSMDRRLETVNMGQGAYGIDQASLWYLRDGINLEHQIHLFAMIGTDIDRSGKNFSGYQKPYLELQNNSLVVRNVPVPVRSYYVPWLTENYKAICELKSIRLLTDLKSKSGSAGKKSNELHKAGDKREIAIKVFENLFKADNLKRIQLIIIYLPTKPELEQDNDSNSELRKFLSSELSKRNIAFMDLFDDFKRISSTEMESMFINRSKYPMGVGHYSAKGNRYVANVVYKRILLLLDPGDNHL